MDLHQLIYVSAAQISFTEDELIELLQQCRDKNSDHNISGMLLYAKGNFMQVLEGDKTALEETYDRIAQDNRHHNLVLIEFEPIAERAFAEWSMAFHHFHQNQLPVGYSDFLMQDDPASYLMQHHEDLAMILQDFRRFA